MLVSKRNNPLCWLWDSFILGDIFIKDFDTLFTWRCWNNTSSWTLILWLDGNIFLVRFSSFRLQWPTPPPPPWNREPGRKGSFVRTFISCSLQRPENQSGWSRPRRWQWMLDKGLVSRWRRTEEIISCGFTSRALGGAMGVRRSAAGGARNMGAEWWCRRRGDSGWRCWWSGPLEALQ